MNLIARFKIEDREHTVIAAPGETWQELCDSLHRIFPNVTDIIPNDPDIVTADKQQQEHP